MRLVLRNTSGRLPTSSYDLVDDAGQVLGFAQLRHRHSCNADLPPAAGSHVFYQIAEPYRGRGYGRALLGLALAEAKRIGLERVRVTVRDDNPISRRIIEAHGAVWLQEFVCRRGQRYHLFEV